jgi:hypothetical protein
MGVGFKSTGQQRELESVWNPMYKIQSSMMMHAAAKT